MPKWLLRIAILKVTKRAAQIFVAWLIAQKLEQYGVKIVDSNQLTLALYAAIEFLRNWIKQTFKVSWL